MAFKKVLGAGFILAAAVAAHADNYITFTGTYGPADTIGLFFNNGTDSVSYSSGVVAGFLQFTDDSNQGLPKPTFETLCGDIFDDIGTGSTYMDQIQQSNVAGGSPKDTNATDITNAGNIIAKDFTNVLTSNSNANDKAAALQIAVWAALYDTGYTVNNVSDFQTMLTTNNESTHPLTVSGFSDWTDAYAYWQDQSVQGSAIYLQHLGPGTNGNVNGQDQFTPNATPEPFTMGLGLAGVGLAVRRRLRGRVVGRQCPTPTLADGHNEIS